MTSLNLLSKMDICPLFTCKVSRRDIYSIKSFDEIIKFAYLNDRI